MAITKSEIEIVIMESLEKNEIMSIYEIYYQVEKKFSHSFDSEDLKPAINRRRVGGLWTSEGNDGGPEWKHSVRNVLGNLKTRENKSLGYPLVNHDPKTRSYNLYANPNWNEEEVVIVLNLYLKIGNHKAIKQENLELIEVSALLRWLGEKRIGYISKDYRSPYEVSRKILSIMVEDPKVNSSRLASSLHSDKMSAYVWKKYSYNTQKLTTIINSILDFLEIKKTSHFAITNATTPSIIGLKEMSPKQRQTIEKSYTYRERKGLKEIEYPKDKHLPKQTYKEINVESREIEKSKSIPTNLRLNEMKKNQLDEEKINPKSENIERNVLGNLKTNIPANVQSWNKGKTKIPANAQSELVRRRQAGATWTNLTKWLKSEFGIDIHRTNIQKWYYKEDYSDQEDELLDPEIENIDNVSISNDLTEKLKNLEEKIDGIQSRIEKLELNDFENSL